MLKGKLNFCWQLFVAETDESHLFFVTTVLLNLMLNDTKSEKAGLFLYRILKKRSKS